MSTSETRRRGSAIRAMLFLLCGLFWASSVQAQVIEGQLLDDVTNNPVATATINFTGESGQAIMQVTTNEFGRFVVTAPSPGRYQLVAARIGYQTVTSPILDFEGADTIQVALRISRDAIPLEVITVTAPPSQLERFQERMRHSASGAFFGPEELRRIRPDRPSNLLREIIGLNVHHVRGRTSVTMRNRGGQGECLPNMVIDGLRLPPDSIFTVDDQVSASNLGAVEVYRPGEVPMEHVTGMNHCGAIVVWTALFLGIDPQ